MLEAEGPFNPGLMDSTGKCYGTAVAFHTKEVGTTPDAELPSRCVLEISERGEGIRNNGLCGTDYTVWYHLCECVTYKNTDAVLVPEPLCTQ